MARGNLVFGVSPHTLARAWSYVVSSSAKRSLLRLVGAVVMGSCLARPCQVPLAAWYLRWDVRNPGVVST